MHDFCVFHVSRGTDSSRVGFAATQVGAPPISTSLFKSKPRTRESDPPTQQPPGTTPDPPQWGSVNLVLSDTTENLFERPLRRPPGPGHRPCREAKPRHLPVRPVGSPDSPEHHNGRSSCVLHEMLTARHLCLHYFKQRHKITAQPRAGREVAQSEMPPRFRIYIIMCIRPPAAGRGAA